MKTAISVSTLLYLLFVCACSKKSETNDTPENCDISRLSQQGDTTALNTYYSYNPQGLPARIKASNYEVNFSYADGKVFQEEGGITRVYTIGTDSLAQYSIIRFGADADSTIYLYNAEKYQVKSIHYFKGIKKDSIGYVIENGNVKSMTYYNEYGYVNYFREFTYHTNLDAKNWVYTKLTGDYGYFYYPWLGKPNKNLLKSSAQYTEIETYNYQFDAGGKIGKFTITSIGTPNVTATINIDYNCR